jgi:hypothetical protein
MGTVMPTTAKPRELSLTAQNDAWLRKASAAAVAEARKAIKDDGAIPPNTPVGRLSDRELGWIVSGALFGWISVRSRQAVEEGRDQERTIRTTGLAPAEPWDVGAVMAILPQLAEACPGLDWTRSVGDWPRETIAEFLLVALRLVRRAVIARDFSDRQLTGGERADVIARQANYGAGGPLMTPDEFDTDLPPF